MVRFSLLAFLLLATPAAAEEYLLGTYLAWIGGEDLYNSKGKRLGDAVSVLRQDRANFHRFGIRHALDEPDHWFHQIEARGAMPDLFQSGGGVSAETARRIVEGHVHVAVYLMARDGNFTSMRVDILD